MAVVLHTGRSANISMIGYDASKRLRYVCLASDELYDYANVPGRVFNEFQAGDSKGRYHRSHIRGAFRFRTVDDTALRPAPEYKLFPGEFSLSCARSIGQWF